MKGKYRTQETPYLRVPTEVFDTPAREVVMKYASSRGKTEPALKPLPWFLRPVSKVWLAFLSVAVRVKRWARRWKRG